MFYRFSALVPVSEEVRSRCHVKHTLPRWPVEPEPDLIAVDSDNMNNQTVSIIKKNKALFNPYEIEN